MSGGGDARAPREYGGRGGGGGGDRDSYRRGPAAPGALDKAADAGAGAAAMEFVSAADGTCSCSSGLIIISLNQIS